MQDIIKKAHLIIYRIRQRGLEVFLVNHDLEGEDWHLPQAPISQCTLSSLLSFFTGVVLASNLACEKLSRTIFRPYCSDHNAASSKLCFYSRSELETNPAPDATRRAGRKESRMHQRECAIHGGKRSCDEVALFSKSCRAKLRGSVITSVKEVVDFGEKFQPPMHFITRAEAGDGVSRRSSGTQIIDAIRLMQIVFIAACIRF